LEKGLALKCNEFTTLAYKLDRLLDHPEQLDAMQERMKLYSYPFAAQTIVNTLLHAPAVDAAVIEPEQKISATSGMHKPLPEPHPVIELNQT
jgi:processive 1,2-diacylglycerol beta-glucosyltransferase